MKDLNITFPQVKYFNRSEGDSCVSLLESVLRAVAAHRPKVGYATGMNYLAACLIYHSCAIVAFWIMIQLIDEYKLDEVYQVGCPGLVLHSAIIDMLLYAQEDSKAPRIVCGPD